MRTNGHRARRTHDRNLRSPNEQRRRERYLRGFCASISPSPCALLATPVLARNRRPINGRLEYPLWCSDFETNDSTGDALEEANYRGKSIDVAVRCLAVTLSVHLPPR